MNKYLYSLDLSMSCTGIAIFNLHNFQPVLATSVSPNDKLTHGERLFEIHKKYVELVEIYPPTEVAIERGFERFPTATQVTFRVHGVTNLFFKDYPQTYYPPKEVKAGIAKGNSSKAQVQKKLLEKYPDIEFANTDESDAFSVGIYHLIKKYKMEWKK